MKTQTRPDRNHGCVNCKCDKTKFYDFLRDFPTVGVINRLYVDKSNGAVYIWDGSGYITPITPSATPTPTPTKTPTPTPTTTPTPTPTPTPA